MADASRVQVRYVAESTWGTTPASAMTNFRATSARLAAVNNTIITEELRSDGQVADMVRVGVSATASIGFELSYGTLDDFLEGALRSTWATDTGLSGAESGTDLLANGTTLKSYTLEGEFSDITQFLILKGCRVGQVSLSFRNQATVTGTIDFTGKVASIAQVTAGTGAATAATTTDVMSAVNVSGFTEGGSSTEVLAWDLTINNNVRTQPILGTAASSMKGIGLGRFVVTGSLETYFADETLYEKYLDFTATTHALTVADAAGNTYVFSLPRVRYTDGNPDVTGNDTDVILPQAFQAVYDSSTGKTLRVARTAA